jgi:mannitol/fructose-specific phosphotransferase system IIA component (Ntr-type)
MTTARLPISEVLTPQTIDLDLEGITCKEEAIEYLASLLDRAGLLLDKDAYIQSVYERESLGPTYMEQFIAIPHGKCDAVKEAGIGFGRSKAGFQYQTQQGGGLAKLVFLLAIPNRYSADAYMAVLAGLARLLVHEEFRDALYQAESYQDVLDAITRCEQYLEDLNPD